MATGGKLGSSQVDASDALHDFACAPCSDDGKNTEASFHCTDCQIFYCQRCVTGHNKFTKNHSVIDKTSKLFGQGQKQPRSLSSGELPTDLCKEHHGQVIQMFCGEHDQVCCTICIAVKHRSCEGVEYIPNIAKRLLKKQDKDKAETSLEKVKDDLQTWKSKMLNELKELNKQRDGILDEIQKFKKRIIARVEELEKESLKEVKDKHKEIADDINACSNAIDDMLKDVELQLDKLRHSKTDNEGQIFVDIKYGEMKVSAGNDCVRQTSTRQVKTLRFETKRDIEDCIRNAQSFGALKVITAENATWDDYIDQLVAMSHVSCLKATIIGLDGATTWISDTHNKALKLSETEKKTIVECFKSKNFDDFKEKGITVEGTKYPFLKTDGIMLVHGKIGEYSEVILHATKSAVVIAISTEGNQADKLKTAVTLLASFLISVGY